jgi:hypothetical protein
VCEKIGQEWGKADTFSKQDNHNKRKMNKLIAIKGMLLHGSLISLPHYRRNVTTSQLI